MNHLEDSYGRRFKYLRLSVTDRCNFRCVYCLPDGYQPQAGSEPELSLEEIQRLCAGFDRLGFSKIRLTGGEPALRRDLVEIVSAVAALPNIETVALTTNGHNLERLAEPLRGAGLSAVNVSLDSLDPEVFRKITGSGRFENVFRGIDKALECGFRAVKVNAVLLRGLTDQEVPAFLEWVRTRPVSVRFIELMRTGRNVDLFRERHLGAGDVQFLLLKNGWKPVARKETEGPAVEYAHPDYAGRIGLIAPYSKEFCHGCNRLRVSSRGALRLCLFGDGDFGLRPSLAGDDYAESVAERVRELILRKPESHLLQEGKYGNTWNLASIGG